MKAVIGIVIWLAMIYGAVTYVGSPAVESTHPVQQLTRFAMAPRVRVSLRFEPEQWLAVGDPIYEAGKPNTSPIGRIVQLGTENSTDITPEYATVAVAEFYSSAPELTPNTELQFYETPSSLEWVIATMLPQHKRQEIANLMAGSLEIHQEKLWRDLQPIIARVLNESQGIIQQDLRRAIANRSEAFSRISTKYQQSFIDKKLIPVFEREVWPIVREEASPLMDEIGSELWAQASIWRLSWRYLYDISPLPQKDLTKKEFGRFVEDKGIPLVKQYLPAIMKVQQRIFHRVANNQNVAQVFREGFSEITNDREIKNLLNEIFQDVFVNNLRLQETWTRAWESQEMRQVMQDANERLGPTVTQIGEAMFGNPKKEITPEFSEVLRSRVLFKDSRWLVLHTADIAEGSEEDRRLRSGESLLVRTGQGPVVRPFHLRARPRRP